jgi:hypothetical protein
VVVLLAVLVVVERCPVRVGQVLVTGQLVRDSTILTTRRIFLGLESVLEGNGSVNVR